ncbi:PqqD family protein [Streptomyces sp. GSL17-111]|uniref:PqqD family protein n=1 Tax=Streptomyces sp. GSL17-111 TaxID=3121596 RepID=UPI0030F38718
MRVQPLPGVGVDIRADGSLELRFPDTAGRSRAYRYSPACTAMWIALRRLDGDRAAAAETLARHWGTNPVGIRAELDVWVAELCEAGLARLAQ